ncbi:Mu transposase C-terminal domain-containing protein [Neorhizobium alkalisoli]|uniref:Mu transposase-like protein n=1 Tax=Neorhizobium alkalisoli TaxID=528178 RepID=A0A561QGH2_9HYPH|nr:Mu transposase C-terminal domain-containing protein [Neorhizobium alkalisoli]TWF49472.1 Mu transposase-like protein [Neorhizobium alkalisoli]
MPNLIASTRVPTYVPTYFLSATARVTIDGKLHYKPVESSDIGHVIAPESNPARREFFSHVQFYEMMCTDRLEVDQEYHYHGREKTRARFGDARVTDLAEDAMVRVLGNTEYCKGFLRRKAAYEASAAEKPKKGSPKLRRISLSDACLDWLLPDLEAEIAGQKRGGKVTKSVARPSNRHFRRIFKRFYEGGYDPMSLAARTGSRVRISYHHPEDVVIWDEFSRKYAHHLKPTMAKLLKELAAEIVKLNLDRAEKGLRLHKVPGRKVFEGMIKSLNAFWVCAQREGEEAARKKYNITFTGLQVERPGEMVQMDEWTVDLIQWLGWTGMLARLSEDEIKAIRKVRLRVVVAIDIATRCILAMRFTPSAATEQAVIDSLEMMATDKARLARLCGATSLWPYHLTPECIVTDNGGPFTGIMVRAVMTALGCDYMNPPAGLPQMRGAIESLFHTFATQFMDWFEGRTFGDIFEKGDYKAHERVSLAIDQLNLLFVQAIVDIYHHQPHSGLAGETPHNAWMRLSRQYGVMPPPPRSVRRHIFGTTVERDITDQGVCFWGIHYQSKELQQIRLQAKRKVMVRVDRFSLDAVSVWTGTGWLVVKALEAIPEDLSIWEWVGARREVTVENAGSTELNLSTMLQAVNRLRLAGEAATARANLATQPIDAEKLNKLQLQYFDGVVLRDDLERRDPTLAPLVFAADPLHHGIEGVDDDLPADENQPAIITIKAAKLPAAIKPATDISF